VTGELAVDDEAYVLTGLAVPEEIEVLHDLLARVGTEHPDLSPTDLMLFETAVIEIANNVVEHGLPPGEVTWTFRLEVLDDRLEAMLSDDGHALREAAPAAMPDSLAESGRGIALADAALDHLSYVRREDVNHWRLVRNRS
jgi:serine/threonine-protein kinase RsbW